MVNPLSFIGFGLPRNRLRTKLGAKLARRVTNKPSVRGRPEYRLEYVAMRHGFAVGLLGASVLLLTPGGIASAQSPIVSRPDSMALSPALSDLPDAHWMQGPQDLQVHPAPMKLPPRAAGSGSPNPAATQTKAGAHLPFTPQTNFAGIGANGYIPPDPNIAVGLSNIVQVVNSEFAVFDKSGNIVPNGGPKRLSTIWSALGGPCARNNAGDAVVQYDKLADNGNGRWIITQLGGVRRPFSECIAVSTSSNPLGTYALYSYSFGNNLNDYPKFGIWPTTDNSAYLATYNMFANGQTFSGAQLCAYDRKAMLAGQPATASARRSPMTAATCLPTSTGRPLRATAGPAIS
jgi:hypothetical protein